MFRDNRPLRIAIVGTNNDKSYSGGRYLALIMAYALAAEGLEVHVVTNKKPLFQADLEPIAAGRVSYCFTADFTTDLPSGPFDYVILIPTGIFLPEFYESALAFARAAGARLALLNFESATWFNTLAPEPKDPRLWDYWRRVVVEGALVVSIAHASQPFAKSFYAAPEAVLRFEVMRPPINTHAADAIGPIERDDAILCFVRSTDPHKGGADLLALDPQLFAGRILRIVSGSEMDAGFRAALHDRIATVAGARLELHTAVSDSEKFALIARSKVLLFPSRFEGFGYPPVEAAYMGTEIACYDLPVLRETVGDNAHMAKPFDTESLGQALAAALAAPSRADSLRHAVAGRFGLPAAGAYLHEILARSLDAVPSLRGPAPLAAWAPWRNEQPLAPAVINRNAPLAPVPPHLFKAARTAAGDIAVEIRVACDRAINFADVAHPAFGIADPHFRALQQLGDWTLYGVTFLAPPEMLGQEFRLKLRQRGQKYTFDVELRIDTATAMEHCELDLSVIQPLARGRMRLAGAVRGEPPPDEIAITANGLNWAVAPCHNGRFDVTAPLRTAAAAGLTVYAYRAGRLAGVFGGFPATAALRRTDLLASPAVATPRSFRPVNFSDANWINGILRNPLMPDLGVMMAAKDDLVGVAAGSLVRFTATGRILEISTLTVRGNVTHVGFSRALSANLEGFPHPVELIGAQEIKGLPLLVEPITEGSWLNGVWCGEGPYSGRLVRIANGQQPERLLWGVLAFPQAGPCIVEAVMPGPEAATLLLDRPVLPVSDTLEPAIIHAAASGPDDRPLRIAERSGNGWQNGIATKEPLALRRVLFAADEAAAEGLLPGRVLGFGGSGLRTVVSVNTRDADTVEVVVDRALSPARDGSPGIVVRPVGKKLAQSRQSTPLYPSPVEANDVKWPLVVIERQRADRPGNDPAAEGDLIADRPRVLFCTLVPPLPADQGNRVVTKNFIAHLVAQGYDVDLLLVGEIDPAVMTATFGDRVRVFSWPFAQWSQNDSAKLRQGILASLRVSSFSESEKFVQAALQEGANWYHPFFIIPDQAVAIARRLYARHAYHSLVCNYTHTVRIAAELEDIRPLPPVAIITHDALSRLPLANGVVSFDTAYRHCPPEVERAALDMIAGARVLAISQSEVRYFHDIGVQNPVYLCEYDGFDEFEGHRTPETAFDEGTFVFQGSANPLNIAAMNWFADTCWSAILRQMPQARLVVCGRLSTQWKPRLPNLSLLGILPREKLLALAQNTTVAINPTVAGTGLKIKTVEAACAGTPSVFLPRAVEGIEDAAGEIGLLAITPEEFVRHCVTLATDRALWSGLRASALKLAEKRFAARAVYAQADVAMGWDRGTKARVTAARLPYVLGAPPAIGSLPKNDKTTQLAVELLELGEEAAAIRLLERTAALPTTPAGCFSLLIGTHCLTAGRHAEALSHAADRLADAPWDLRAYDLMIAALIGINRPVEAEHTVRLAALACPASPDLAALEDRIRAYLITAEPGSQRKSGKAT